MQVLLVQLSDIHITGSDKWLVERADIVARAVVAEAADKQACVLLFTGDLTYGGKPEEYYLALDFILRLKKSLVEDLPATVSVHIALIPGNHDCDLAESPNAREMLRDSLATQETAVVDSSIIELGTKVQRGFFDLLEGLDGEDRNRVELNKLYYEYRIDVCGERLDIRCLNSSWLSQMKEKEGSLFFPVQLIPQKDPNAKISIAMLHHPFAWYTVSVRRDLQKKLESVSDLIFTGHEHEHTRRSQITGLGETNQFIEGGAFYKDDQTKSEFNVLHIDTDNMQQRFARLTFKNDIYVASHRNDPEPFQVNRLRARKEFELTDEWARNIEDPGATFEKPGVGRPQLSKFFVFPELRQVSLRTGDGNSHIAGEEAFDSVEPPNLLISGAEQIGKTALAKSVFARVKAQGLVPIYIDGARFVPQRKERLREQMLGLFTEQYGEDSVERFSQLERARRVVIIDNFHRIRINAGDTEQLLNTLEVFAGRVFLFTNDLVHAFGEILRAGTIIEERQTFAHYRIVPFGYAKRIELTTKWLSLGGRLDDAVLAKRLAEAEDRMEVVLGKNFVPAFPIFLLALLQGLDTATQADIVASTYGYFYEILIKATLAKDSTQPQVNVRNAYLTHLAWTLFKSGRTEITQRELKDFHDDFVKRFDLSIAFREHVQDLLDRLVLWHHSDSYGFKYPYFFYYFVAKYIQLQLTANRAEATPIVDDLTTNLGDEVKANVLLFLVHLSPDPVIVEKIVQTATGQFGECDIARLEEDVAFLGELAVTSPELQFEEASFAENRQALAQERDQIERETGEHRTARAADQAEKEMAAIGEMIARLVRALKTVQILGQVLKNHPASFDAESKEKAAVECYSLGLRVLGYMLGMLREGREDLMRHAVESIRAERPNESGERVVRLANNVVFGLGLLGAFGIIKRVGSAVGSPELVKTYERVEARMPYVSTKLINVSVRLDGAEFPRGELLRMAALVNKSALPAGVLRWLVFAHVNLFPTNFRDRQPVFEAVGIKYKGSIGANPNKKLLAPGRLEG